MEPENQMEHNSDAKAGKSCRAYLACQSTGRVLAAAASMAAMMIMVFSEQSNTYYGFTFVANYKTSPAFRFLVFVNAAALGYTLISVPLSFCMATKILINILDILAMGLLTGAAAAATAIGDVGKHGNIHTGWIPVCQNFQKFCHRAGISIGCTYFASAFLLVVILSSSFHKPS